ncbi:MAG: hypothetical protein H0T46_23790 [Deltaproteobacteria bacterium]|nr:hypothetical protein [Deltaproteobacteria bacterium]
MRTMVACVLVAGCGFGVPASTAVVDADIDAPPPPIDAFVRDVPPRLIPGGGIADAPLAHVLNVYAIDSVTRLPIMDASVTIGAISGMTDATGLFVARGEAVTGKATIAITKEGYRAEIWIGVAGANATLPLKPQPLAGVPRADLSGVFSNFNSNLPPLGGGHLRSGSVTYSQLDGAPDGANGINSMGSNRCQSGSCAFSIATRVGTVALLGATFDVDTKNTQDPNDDTSVVQTYSYRTGITVVDGVALNNQNLTQIAPSQLVDVTTTFGTLAPGTTVAVGVVAIDLPTEGTLYLSDNAEMNTPTIKAPPLSLFAGSSYRVLGFAGVNGGFSLLFRRGFTASPFNLGTWLPTPTLVSATRAGASWTAPTGATFSGVLYSRPFVADLVQVLSFDGTTTFTLPPAITLPTASFDVSAIAFRAGYDFSDFSFAEDAALYDATSSSSGVAVP